MPTEHLPLNAIAMSHEAWIDTAAVPPTVLPVEVDAALAYVGNALGHPVYRRWTLTEFRRGWASLADARRAHPTVFRLLLDHPVVIEWWSRGRLQAAPEDIAPSPCVILARLLRQQRRFRPIASDATVISSAETGNTAPADMFSPRLAWLAQLSNHPETAAASGWLTCTGRFANPVAATNALGAHDDAHAVALFLHERGMRSAHTVRAYLTELRRLIGWCMATHLGPLSDLTRQNLIAYAHSLNQSSRPAPHSSPSTATRMRALAVVSSLFHFWYRTGYLVTNPAAGLTTGARARSAWSPTRFLPPHALARCEQVIAGTPDGLNALIWTRRAAIWALSRYAGVRRSELVWSETEALPRLEVEAPDAWTLVVHGKGNRRRAIPLPSCCLPALRSYRLARGLPVVPSAREQLPLIHGEHGGGLGASGLYDEIKSVFVAAAAQSGLDNPELRSTLLSASPHWLRHAYAHTLVVDRAVPLPVAQALLGHASVQTTAAYAQTDRAKARTFVETSFPSSC
ncbi:tyrosine-type recombinase/integrase [Burkholderia ubonensis]|uniref:tyrosine-type recombinase/integrase n=1 Tax=Burkholderia ubonensis TaxID=101571 RepID=UPI000ABBF3D4|nr:tyrosine-type recombinase/integrase [Burkholderia ubonensis]